MGLGILEPSAGGHVPGTSFMGGSGPKNDGSGGYEGEQMDPKLKYDTTGSVPVVLVPQPSDDPNDPLNWSLAKRDCITAILCCISVLASCLSSILASNTIYLAIHLNENLNRITALTGYQLCGVGASGLIIVATARIWGKRHLYVFGTILLCASSIWAGAAQSYKSLLWARIIQGVAACPFEALVNASVGDLYCVHQRGKRMALTNFALFGGAFMTPVVVGKITSVMGWRWPFYFVAIFSGALVPLVFFFCPETAYCRATQYNIDLSSSSQTHILPLNPGRVTPAAMDFPDPIPAFSKEAGGTPIEHLSTDAPPPRVTFLQSLALFNGRKSPDSLWKLVVRPIALIVHPAVFWGMITQGALIGWSVMIGVVLAYIFMQAPTRFQEKEVGYMYAGAFLGATLGFLLAGALADWSTRLMTRWNKGVFEPEFRILLVIPQALTGITGVFLFGWTASKPATYGWALPDFFFGMEVMGMILGAVAASLYIVDAHRNIAVEVFTTFLLFKNFFSYALTTGAFNWLQEMGTWRLFWTIGVIQVAVCVLSVPMYVFGKRNRRLMHRWDLLRLCRLD